jgi:nucleoside-diphosphate-sugar epimerase
MFLLGATGFIGQRVVREALAAGWQVKALVRSQTAAKELAALGVIPVIGDASDSSSWSSAVRDAQVVIDLVQPKIPSKVTLAAIQQLAAERLSITQQMLDVLQHLPSDQRPLLISVSGTDDLQPDADSRIGPFSKLKSHLQGFGHIGIPVRQLVKRSGVAAVFVYLASVYGPGKTFADVIAPKIAAGRWKVIGGGSNRMPLIHVDDAARALVHVAGLKRASTLGRTFVVAHAAALTARQFFDDTAAVIGASKPGQAPVWLASLIAGKILVETMTRDLVVDSSNLTASGFHFKYPTHREGVIATLRDLGYKSSVQQRPIPRKNVPFWLISIATFGLLAAENLLHFKWSIPNMLTLSKGLPLLDMRFTYTPDDTYRLFEMLGLEGRQTYLQLIWSVDILIPLLSMVFLWAALSRGVFRKWRGFALAGGVFDYMENIAITSLLLFYPDRTDGLAYVAATLTSLKFLAYAFASGLAIAGYGRTLWGRKPSSQPGPICEASSR